MSVPKANDAKGSLSFSLHLSLSLSSLIHPMAAPTYLADRVRRGSRCVLAFSGKHLA